MPYTILSPPFSLDLHSMSKKELLDHNGWFHSVIPERIAMLAAEVQATKGFEDWSPDYSVESLGPLNEWFAGQIQWRPRTNTEMKALRAATNLLTEEDRIELTVRTYSLAVDIAMYFGKVIEHNNPDRRWSVKVSGRKYVDYGLPILSSEGKMDICPSQLMMTHAWRLARNRRDPIGLVDIYNRQINPPVIDF